jgi:hypothetical protein
MRPSVQHHRGTTALECLLVLPLLLLIGLGVVQFGLLYQAQQALRFAAHEAARSGSVAHGEPSAIRSGFARGLSPWLFGADNLGAHLANIARTRAHVALGEQVGWIQIEQVSPRAESFRDWALPARDDHGRPIPGIVEIPSDQMAARVQRHRPGSGTTRMEGGEAVGQASQQTLREANRLHLRVRYGVPLSVPIVGRIIAEGLRTWHGCQRPRPLRYGLIDLGSSGEWVWPDWRRCSMYGLTTVSESARLPIQVTAQVTMQSPARPFR